jgi:hypothetical protein
VHERGLCVLGAGQALVERASGGAERVAHPLCRPRVTDVVRAARGHPWVVEQPMIARRASSRRFACLDLAHQLLDRVADLELLTLPTLRSVSPRRPARLERVRWGWRGSRLASVGWLALAPALALALLGPITPNCIQKTHLQTPFGYNPAHSPCPRLMRHPLSRWWDFILSRIAISLSLSNDHY